MLPWTYTIDDGEKKKLISQIPGWISYWEYNSEILTELITMYPSVLAKIIYEYTAKYKCFRNEENHLRLGTTFELRLSEPNIILYFNACGVNHSDPNIILRQYNSWLHTNYGIRNYFENIEYDSTQLVLQDEETSAILFYIFVLKLLLDNGFIVKWDLSKIF